MKEVASVFHKSTEVSSTFDWPNAQRLIELYSQLGVVCGHTLIFSFMIEKIHCPSVLAISRNSTSGRGIAVLLQRLARYLFLRELHEWNVLQMEVPLCEIHIKWNPYFTGTKMLDT